MRSEWKSVCLNDVVSKLGDGLHGTPVYDDKGEYYFINGNNLDNGQIVFKENTKRVGFDQFQKHQKELNDRTLLVSINGTIGNVAYYKNESVVLGKSACYFNVLPDVNKVFIRYILASPHFQAHIEQQATGTTIKNVSLKTMREYSFLLPPRGYQDRVAAILGTLDNKIALNRQINTTLESMAQALFKSWFVDFDPVIDNALTAGHEIPDELQARADRRRALLSANTETTAARLPQGCLPQGRLPQDIQQLFPDRFVFTEEMGWVPEGWEVKTLSSMIELIGGGTPKTSVEEFWGGDIPWFSVVDAPSPSDVFVLSTEKSITQIGLDNSSAKLLPKGTTIISARGTVGKCAVVARPMAMNQSCYGLRGVGGNADYFTYYMVLRKVQELQQRSHGSVFSTITRDTFKGLNVAACSPLLTQKFDTLISGHMDRMLGNLEQIQVLSNLRDSLLPKLLSGQLSIPEAEQALDEVS